MGRVGFFARALVLLIVGGFLILAALHANSSEARGIAGALNSLQQQPYGWALLGATALGLFAFGAFQFVIAVYRRIDAPSPAEAVNDVEADVRRAVG
jgi:H+/Cl- antiporter ClcA